MEVKEKVAKQLDVGFLEVIDYPQWLANIVPVPKKDGKVRMCVDYRDLKRARPYFPILASLSTTLLDTLCFHSWMIS